MKHRDQPPNKPLKLTAADFRCAGGCAQSRRGRLTRGRSLAAIRWAAPAGVLGAFRMAEELMIRAFEQTDRQAVIDANLPPVWRAAQLSCWAS